MLEPIPAMMGKGAVHPGWSVRKLEKGFYSTCCWNYIGQSLSFRCCGLNTSYVGQMKHSLLFEKSMAKSEFIAYPSLLPIASTAGTLGAVVVSKRIFLRVRRRVSLHW